MNNINSRKIIPTSKKIRWYWARKTWLELPFPGKCSRWTFSSYWAQQKPLENLCKTITRSCWLVLFFCCLCYSWFSHLYLKNPFAFGDLLSKELELVSRFRQLVEASSPWKSFPSSIIQGGCKMSRGLTGLMLLGHDNLFPQKLRPLLTMVQSWPWPLRDNSQHTLREEAASI